MFYILILLVACGCSAPQTDQEIITVKISVDHQAVQVNVPAGSTVQQALVNAQVDLGELDQVDPPLPTQLTTGSQVRVIRVRHEYFTEQVVIPFEHQELMNEALPEGEKRLNQPGVNGLEEITYRRVFEDELEVSHDIVGKKILHPAISEVIMIGTRPMFVATPIPGKIAYLSAGNAWIMQNTTANRQLVVSTGDLDGRIFSLSDNGEYLLFTRNSDDPETINNLWLATLDDNPPRLIDLGIENIVHFAGFNPDATMLTYSTVEWRETSPGWQANNDLFELGFQSDGLVYTPTMILKPNSGGVYGWWGTEFSWSNQRQRLAYSSPDSIGIVDLANGTQFPILKIDPYQSGANWAWVPGITWSPDDNIIYTVNHLTQETDNHNRSSDFNLIAINLADVTQIELVENVGMFAYPVVAPVEHLGENFDLSSAESITQSNFSVAYLQAIFPDQSDTSLYSLFAIEGDGSDQRKLFPDQNAEGLQPQHVVWSPVAMGNDDNFAIVLIYNGNIWIVDSGTGVARQITGDGLTERIDWR